MRLLHRHVGCPSGRSLPPSFVAPAKLLLRPHVLPAVTMMLSAELREDFDSSMRVRLLPLANRFFSRFLMFKLSMAVRIQISNPWIYKNLVISN